MGLFNSSKGDGVGFAKIPNTQKFTNEDLLEKLSAIKVSFGTPIMGDIKGTQSVMYKKVGDMFDIFVRVDGDNVIMGKLGTDGVSSGATALSMGLDMLLGSKDKGTSTADRAVDELAEIVEKLEKGETVTESTATTSVNTSTGSIIDLYMKQKLLAIKPQFDITDKDGQAVYHVDGDLPRLNFSIKKNGEEVVLLKKKLIAIMPEYTIVVNGQEVGKLKKKVTLLKPQLNGTINGQELKIQGDLFDCNFDILVGSLTIGHIDKDFSFFHDCFRIQVLNEDYQNILMALAIICDNVVDSSQS